VSDAPRFRLRRAVPGDAPALALLGQATFLETYADVVFAGDLLAFCAAEHSVEAYRRLLGDEANALWLACAGPGDVPVGYALLSPSARYTDDARADDLELKRIYLLHRFQGNGLGRRLLQAVLDEARRRDCGRVLLVAYHGNDAAIAFYRRRGFREVGRFVFRVGERGYDDPVLALELQEAR
jgi:ribosomal protein S18 acetylase RimI-like enzyme